MTIIASEDGVQPPGDPATGVSVEPGDEPPADAPTESWGRFDQDGNGELSAAEFTQLRVAQYAALDRNADGQWTRREFVQRVPGMTRGRVDALRGKFKRHDKNDDGLWDTAEAARAIKANFRWLDKNKNGSLAPQEFPKVW